MSHIEGRIVHDADAHVMETGDWLDIMQGNALALESLIAKRP